MNLMADLQAVAGRWAEEHGRRNPSVTLKTLGARTVRDVKLFPRIEAGRPITVPIFEKVAGYLGKPENWPAEVIPEDAANRLALLGVEVPGFAVVIERARIERQLVVRS